MNTVGIKELKNRLTHYLRQTRKGEEIVITDRDRPIALIQRIESVATPQSLEGRMAKMAAEGLITLPTRKPSSRIKRIRIKGSSLTETIVQDRDDRF